MAFKASFKFSDSREFDVLRWDVKFNRAQRKFLVGKF